MGHQSYFELLGVEDRLAFDSDSLKKAYYKVSRKYHPDFFTMSSESEQAEAAKMSELVNEAFTILADRQSRIRYILLTRGVLSEGNQSAIDQDFLIHMMDINEAIFEMQSTDSIDEVATQKSSIMSMVSAFENALEEEGDKSISLYDSGDHSEANLLKIKEYYLKSRYLLRMKENLSSIGK